MSPPKPRPSSLGTHPRHPVHENITLDTGQPWWSQPATMNKSDHKPIAVLPNQLSGQPLHLALTHQLYPKTDFRAISLFPSLRWSFLQLLIHRGVRDQRAVTDLRTALSDFFLFLFIKGFHFPCNIKKNISLQLCQPFNNFVISMNLNVCNDDRLSDWRAFVSVQFSHVFCFVLFF